MCGDNDSDHFAKDCPSKAGSGGGGSSSGKYSGYTYGSSGGGTRRFVFARQAGGHPQVTLYANGPDQAATHNIPKGTRLKVLREDRRRDGDWLQIVADGTGLKGWVKKANVVDRLDGGGGGGGGSSSGKYSGYTYGSSGGGSGGCKVPGCKEAHSKHYCKVCGDNDSDHFAKDCPSKAGSG
eukprot:COSAG06_NODE_18607_length_877_cov_2.715938_2_plen_180_part_01